MLDGPCIQLCSNLLFMIRAGVCRMPVLFGRWRLQRRRIRKIGFDRRNQGHPRTLSDNVHIQLRPVTYRAICDLTLYLSQSYGGLYRPTAPLAGGLRLSSSSSIICSLDPAENPFRDVHGNRAFSAPATSCAKTLRGSCGSTSSQRAEPNTQTTDKARARKVPKSMTTKRGGYDFFSGILAGSKTFTLGVSFASCTLASSYCSVRSSYTVSWIFVCR